MGQYVVDTSNGEFVSEKVKRLAEMLADFDETLYLQYVPELDRGPIERALPYRVMQDAPGHEPYIVMYLGEDELDHRVLASLALARDYGKDGSKDVKLALEYQEAARKAEEEKIRADKRAEAIDQANFLIKTPLHTVKMFGKKLHL